MQRVFSLLVDNNPGVLSRVSGLFSRRGYSIELRQIRDLPELPLWPAEMS